MPNVLIYIDMCVSLSLSLFSYIINIDLTLYSTVQEHNFMCSLPIVLQGDKGNYRFFPIWANNLKVREALHIREVG